MNKEETKPSHPVVGVKDVVKPNCSVPGTTPPQGLKVEDCGDVNMEATITSEDVVRAGGFGARDDISCFLPVASDSTDFEAAILDARDYEEPQGKICRPGLGWKDAKETN